MTSFKEYCIAQPKSKLKARDGISKGLYKFFTSSNIQTKYINVCQYNQPALILGTGGSASIHYCEEPFSVSADCIVFYAKDSSINLKVIYRFFEENMYLLEQGFKGAGLKHISKDYILNIEFKLPILEEQEKIVTILDKVSNLISLRKQQLEKLDLLIKSQFIEMFGEPEFNKYNWNKNLMGNFITTLTDFNANGSYNLLDSNVIMYDNPNYALMVRTIDLEKNDFVNEVKYIDKQAYKLLSKSKIFGNEIIMNKIGSAGKIYLMPYLNRPVSLGRNAFLIRYNENINPVFIYFLLVSRYGTKEIQQYVRGAVTKTITKEAVRAIKIIIPPIKLQNQFADFVQEIEKQKSIIQQGLDKLEILKKALVQEYFG